MVGQGSAGVLLLVPLLFLACGLHLLGMGTLTWLQTWASGIVFAAGGLICGQRAGRVAAERAVWVCFTVACLCWTWANFYYAVLVSPAALPLPSPADIGYFSFPWLLGLAALAYARRYAHGVRIDAVIDVLIVSLAIAAVGAAVIFAVVGTDTSSTGDVITTLVYPAEDVVVVSLFAAVASLFAWRWSLRRVLIGIGVVAIAVSDTLAFGGVLGGNPVGGAWENLGWTAGIALIAISAWREISAPPTPRNGDQVSLFLPVFFGMVALAVLVWADALSLTDSAIVLAAAASVVAFLRLLLSLRETRALADSRRLAVTDDLTRLPNRRRLLADLHAVCERGEPGLLALYDLDGFKHYNDTHGHAGGDRLLCSLAAALRDALPPSGVAYRLGGDEFCVLSAGGHESGLAVRAGSEALRASGPGWTVTASVGTVAIPAEAGDPSAALRIADQRMYAEKNLRPAAARQQARAVLLSALAEQQPTLRSHVGDVTVLAAKVAMALGMTAQEIDDVVRAAELHDIGKLAIPLPILEKPGPLDDEEWAVMRRHTIIGERMLNAAPALTALAPLVRASHERWDGGGYPDGLAGEQIPLGARIVSVCDSYDAMIADRPYRAGRTPEEAIAELRACAGAQFDPAVVAAFVAALGRSAGRPDPVG